MAIITPVAVRIDSSEDNDAVEFNAIIKSNVLFKSNVVFTFLGFYK